MSKAPSWQGAILRRSPIDFFLLFLPLLQLLHQLGRRLLVVALRVVARPAPEILARLLEGALRLPAELLLGAGRVGGQIQDVAGAAGRDLVREIAAHRGGERADHLVDGAALAGTEVPGAHAGAVLEQVVEGLEVAVREVQDVDVVADGGAVVGGVVCSLVRSLAVP